MGRGGKKGFRGRGGRGGGRGGGQGVRSDNRTNKADVVRKNVKFEGYYSQLNLVPEEENVEFWAAMRRDLPNSFRFAGSRAHALAVQQRLKDFYIPEITSITFDGEYVPAPQPAAWYPDQLAWFMTTPKHIIRRFPPFKSFQNFLVAETDVGNITRQEIVSMIPPLLMGIKPGMTVLDLCAAPGSKSAQLIEMLHAGEEDRAREVASHLATGLDRPPGQEYEDDGRSTGLLIANDVDYRRAHMLVHQVKRLSSPNIVVTNHDATVFPSIKIPSLPSVDSKPVPNRYLKFDRILADVPCSGDGTARKNLEIWAKWTPSNGLGLHATQVRILVRALQMLKVGGRVVYSTCSMNPVEDEAVLASAIQRCGGPGFVEIIDTKDSLLGLQRYPGLTKWNIMSKSGRIYNSYEEVVAAQAARGEETLSRISEAMFPPKNGLPLERAMRIYPHQQDTGAFFIAILEKKSEIKARAEEKPATSAPTAKVEAADSNGTTGELETTRGGEIANYASNGIEDGSKRKRELDDQVESPLKRVKTQDGQDPQTNGLSHTAAELSRTVTPATPSSTLVTPTAPLPEALKSNRKLPRDQPFEEPFKYLPSTDSALPSIRAFYTLSPRFPADRFMVRNALATATKNIYYTTSLVKDILTENEGKGMKFVHAGVKMFVKQDAPSPEVCPWRIQTDGLRLVEMWVGPERVVTLWRKSTLRKLLVEMFPRFHGEDWKNLGEVGEQILKVGMGCCVLVCEPRPDAGEEGLNERMVFPLWKSVQSLNLMLPKEERKAMLLRLFNDSTELINLQRHPGGKRPDPRPKDKMEGVEKAPVEGGGQAMVRNSSSPEMEGMPADEVKLDEGVEAAEDETGVETGAALGGEKISVGEEPDEEDGGVGVAVDEDGDVPA